MTLETESAWIIELKRKLSRPYAADEFARLQDWGDCVKRLNGSKTWPPGTFQRLLDLARSEDAARGE